MIIHAPFFDSAVKLFVVLIKYADGQLRRLTFETQEDVDGFVTQHSRAD